MRLIGFQMTVLAMRSGDYLIRLFRAEFNVSTVDVTVTYSAHVDCRSGWSVLYCTSLYRCLGDGE